MFNGLSHMELWAPCVACVNTAIAANNWNGPIYCYHFYCLLLLLLLPYSFFFHLVPGVVMPWGAIQKFSANHFSIHTRYATHKPIRFHSPEIPVSPSNGLIFDVIFASFSWPFALPLQLSNVVPSINRLACHYLLRFRLIRRCPKHYTHTVSACLRKTIEW